ncbi:MAG: ABC transporter substrate-binding protein [Solirubrobacterales bacterium]
MDRRAFLTALGGGLVTAPIAAVAQPAEKVTRVGLVSIGTDRARPGGWQPFVEAMRASGFVEGRNLEIKHAFAGGRPEELPRLVDELLRSGVDVLVVSGLRETAAARRATSTVPIVMMLVADPVGEGFVASLARPGGTITGLTNVVPGLLQKYVELLHEAIPSSSRFAVIANPPNPVPGARRELEAASKSLGITLSVIPVRGPEDFDGGLARAKRDGVGAILATADPVTLLHRKRLIGAALKHRLPGIYWDRVFVEDGGLMSYSVGFADLLRHAAVYVNKILRGARPADLPVEQPTKFELVINQRAAEALGLTIPPSLLARADHVIS